MNIYEIIFFYLGIVSAVLYSILLVFVFKKPSYKDRHMQHYLQHYGLRCPQCDSFKIDLVSDPIEEVEDCLHSGQFCYVCGARWTAIYKLIGYSNLKEGK